MARIIEIPDDLHERLAKLARPFETEAQLIDRLVDNFVSAEPETGHLKTGSVPTSEKSESSTTIDTRPVYTGQLDIRFHPDDPAAFKAKLLQQKSAWILMHYQDGNRVLKQWNASKFKPTSDVLGNLRSGYFRGWREKGMVRADVAIDRSDLGLPGDAK